MPPWFPRQPSAATQSTAARAHLPQQNCRGNPCRFGSIRRVVDLSHYDDVQDRFAGAVKFGIRGVVNKLTEGVGDHDRSFSWRLKPANNAGLLPLGAYHFARPGRIAQQADWFLQNLRNDAGDLASFKAPAVLDLEIEGVSLADAQAWLERVHAALGRWPWLYSYSAFLGEHFTKADLANPFWKQIPLWIAAHNDHPTWPACWGAPWLWQYTGDSSGLEPHNVSGIVIEEGGKGIDINSFDGTDDELAAAWAADQRALAHPRLRGGLRRGRDRVRHCAPRPCGDGPRELVRLYARRRA